MASREYLLFLDSKIKRRIDPSSYQCYFVGINTDFSVLSSSVGNVSRPNELVISSLSSTAMIPSWFFYNGIHFSVSFFYLMVTLLLLEDDF